jgi:hypothetical protein
MVIEPGSEVEFEFAQSREAWGMSNVVFWDGGASSRSAVVVVKSKSLPLAAAAASAAVRLLLKSSLFCAAFSSIAWTEEQTPK